MIGGSNRTKIPVGNNFAAINEHSTKLELIQKKKMSLISGRYSNGNRSRDINLSTKGTFPGG